MTAENRSEMGAAVHQPHELARQDKSLEHKCLVLTQSHRATKVNSHFCSALLGALRAFV